MEYYKTVLKTNREIATELLDKSYNEGILKEMGFSILMQNLLISEGGYVIDVGNNWQVNAVVALRLKEKIKKRPLLWKWFFMVA